MSDINLNVNSLDADGVRRLLSDPDNAETIRRAMRKTMTGTPFVFGLEKREMDEVNRLLRSIVAGDTPIASTTVERHLVRDDWMQTTITVTFAERNLAP